MKVTHQLFFFVCIILAVSACSGVRYLEDGEKWLYKQNLKNVETANKREMREVITLTPNTRVPILGPIGAVIYESGENNFDTARIEAKRAEIVASLDKKIEEREADGRKTKKLEARKTRKLERIDKKLKLGNLRMRTGSPLAVYDSAEIEYSRSRIESYLKGKGYLKAEVEVEKKQRGRKMFQDFVVEEGPRSFIDSLNLRTGDSAITNLINKYQDESFIIVGEGYDRSKIDQERNRLNLLLKDNGYFEFNEQYINFEILYAPDETDLWVTTVINKPANRDKHKVFTLDSIVINTQGNTPIQKTETYEGVTYNSGLQHYNPKVLDARTKFWPDSLYNYTQIVNTQKQLLNMNMFRYVNINFDTTQLKDKFVATIYTAPLKKFQLNQELGLNMTEGVPGPFYNVSLQNRNAFGAAEVLEIGAFVSQEGVSPITNQDRLYGSFQYGGNVSLTFPRFNIPLLNSRLINKTTYNPRNTISLGYNFTKRPGEYTRSNLNGRFSYLWQNKKGARSYTLNVADINLINTYSISDSFRELLEDLQSQGNTLYLSFRRSFVSSTSFNATYNFDYSNPNTPSSFVRVFLESGGNLNNLFGTGLLENNDLQFYEFSKVQLDYRRYLPRPNGDAWVLRANAGAAVPYGESAEGENSALPYEKYFFSGGSSSIRAWSPRRLGPGSAYPYKLDENGQNELDENGELVPDRGNYLFEQPGEILIELNAEYRGNITGFLDYAVFVDAGNVWNFNEYSVQDPNGVIRVSPGAKFSFDRFYKEIAVGVGAGLRMDFSFLVFRFDYGIQIKDPRFDAGDRWQMPFIRRDQATWNIAVGYPF